MLQMSIGLQNDVIHNAKRLFSHLYEFCFQASLRTFSMMQPNVNKLLEMSLLCNGFSDVKNLAEKILFFIQVIITEVRRLAQSVYSTVQNVS